MSRIEFIDNRDGNTLERALLKLLDGEAGSKPDLVRIASAFFSPSGFFLLSDELTRIESVRILLGAAPFLPTAGGSKSLQHTREAQQKNQLKDGLRQMERILVRERDGMPFTKSSHGTLAKMVNALKQGNIEVRRFEKEFLHAKAYIFSGIDGRAENNVGVIAGSSNFTRAGLNSNYELNLGRHDQKVINEAAVWFDELWEEAEPFDLAQLYEDTLEPKRPWDVFIRILWQLYGAEVEEDERFDGGLPLTSFQKHGVLRAQRLIDEFGGVLVADEVGLGKTFIAGEILNDYIQRRQRAVIVCPAALRDSTWKDFNIKHFLSVECLSFEQLANDTQLRDPNRDQPHAQHLQRPLNEYQLVIIDEAHNYRNPSARTRARTLQRLLFGQKRDLLLLTATPVNNSLWDLYTLLRFFLRQDGQLASKGILSMRGSFARAMRKNPSDLHPDDLYPIIDATTVKRTRKFISKHYSNDTILGPGDIPQPIVFPEPEVRNVKFNLNEQMQEFFELLEEALDPNAVSGNQLIFARYTPENYLKKKDMDEEERHRRQGFVNLLRSGLLKRFESSVSSFQQTIDKIERQHVTFLKALEEGMVINTEFLREFSGDDENLIEEMQEASDKLSKASLYHVDALKQDVEHDLKILKALSSKASSNPQQNNTKLKALSDTLVDIVKLAGEKERGLKMMNDMSKVLIFTEFADTVLWINDFLQKEVKTRKELNVYADKIVAVSGARDKRFALDHYKAALRFAPDSMRPAVKAEEPDGTASGSKKKRKLVPDTEYHLMITTDVLAEGVNLQQCCNIINFDVPWNPMKLVQRHGRVDRIGSPHNRVFLRVFFPDNRLERLLKLKQRIDEKLKRAAASIGVAKPIEGMKPGEQVFSETPDEIEKLYNEDASIFKRGGTVAATQSGEEYRQTLREALLNDRDSILSFPWKAGSGKKHGLGRGFLFCAVVGRDNPLERTYLRFVRATKDWNPMLDGEQKSVIVEELGTCLRLLECEPETDTWYPDFLNDRVFDFWDEAKSHIYDSWSYETDPANLQPPVDKLNHRVAAYIRKHTPSTVSDKRTHSALDVLESPWPYRERKMLQGWFEESNKRGIEKSVELIEKILSTGLEKVELPPPLPPIDADEDIELLCWMAIESDIEEGENGSQVDSGNNQPGQSETTD